YGGHPVPTEYGGGWCFIDNDHWHEYQPAAQSYSYSGSYYTYVGPTEVWYYDYHPIPTGGSCHMHGRHSHGYTPGSAYANNYYWDNTRDVYVYGDNYHGASGVSSPGGNHGASGYNGGPPPGSGTYNTGGGYFPPGGNGTGGGVVAPPGTGMTAGNNPPAVARRARAPGLLGREPDRA